jgi:succinyl-diaminopimelate desuccinylase
VVEMGPRNATIHKINEYVEIKDLEQLPEIYRLTLEKLLLK